MATKMVRQTMFTSGEVDNINFKRTDSEAYLTAAQSLLNCEIGTTGLARKRKGTKFLLNTSIFVSENSKIYEFSDKNGVFYLVMSINFGFQIFVINGDILTYIQTVIGTPYTTDDLPFLDYADDNDVIIFNHPFYPPARLYISDYTTLPYPTFNYAALNIYPLPAFDFGNVFYDTATVTIITNTPTNFSFTFASGTALPFTTDWIGGQIVGLGSSPTSPIGYGIITAVVINSPTSVTFSGNVMAPFATTMPTSGSQYIVRQPSWSNTLGWPAKVLFYQNRLWMANAGTLNNTVFGSKTNAPTNFDVGSGRDTDAIIYTIGQSNSGSIEWMNGGKQLEIYTENFEFAAPQQQDLGLTPGTFSIRQQSAYGSTSFAKPITYLNDSYFINKTGNALSNFHFDGIGQTYSTSNISVASTHLIMKPINRALLRGTNSSQDNFVYYLNSQEPDGSPNYDVTAFQFAAEYKLAALTPIKFVGETPLFPDDPEAPRVQIPTEVLDITQINNEIYFLKYLPVTDVTFIDKFISDVKMDSYVDGTMQSNGVVEGLIDFEDYYVQVIYQNQDYGQYLVQNGIIIVDRPAPGTQIGDVQVGFLYPVKITPMYVFGGAVEAEFFKKISSIYVNYYNTLGMYINGTLVNFQSFAEIQAGLPLTPKSDMAYVRPVNGWARFGTFDITQNTPFDLQIVSISYQIETTIV